MRFSSLAIAALSATGALAAPWGSYQDDKVTVELSDSGAELATQTQLKSDVRDASPPVGSSGPFKQVNIRLGKDVANKELRCKLLDHDSQPIVAIRGANVDTTFSDADKGAWTFKYPSNVSKIICDPAFKANNQAAPPVNENNIKVTLENQSIELGSNTFFTEGARQEKQPTGSTGPFDTVTLTLDDSVKNKDLRCQILDLYGHPIKVKRGENEKFTFGDGGKGAWTFLDPHKSNVSKIVCDPAFKV